MDYEKEYKEALEKARLFHKQGIAGGNPIMAKRYEQLFPELAESEDEKVWQWIREHINHDGTNMFDKAVAWLEKQKEQKPADCIFTFDDILALESAMFLAKGDEDLYNALKSIFERVHDIYHDEQKPAEWSEEDEKMRKLIVADIKSLAHGDESSMWVGYADWLEGRLKSLRPQTKQDVLPSLSEKEIICLKRALDYLRKEHNRYGGEDFTNEIVVLEWLITHPILVYSSLPHWKPSEEQLSILGKVFAGCELNTTERESMVDLFNNLKQML